jgi:hypothetical protein
VKNLLLVFGLLIMSQSAHAGVGLLGGVSFHNVSTDNGAASPSIDKSAKLGGVGGFAFSSNFLLLNLEIDALYDNRTLNFANNAFNVSSPAIQVPVLARFSILPSILDIGVGPYASFNIGSNDLGYASPDIGGVGSVRVTLPFPGIHFVLDGRYNFGFTNLSQIPLVTAHTREVQILAGIDIPFFGGSDDHGTTTTTTTTH